MLSVVVPAWNEEDGIAVLVAAALQAGDELATDPAHGIDHVEVVVVDDGSDDGTAARVRELRQADPRVVLVGHGINRGLGAAIRTGIRAAQGDLVLYTDADLPVDFAELPAMLAEYRRSEVAMVAAHRDGSDDDGPRRWVYRHAYDRLIRALFGVPIEDVNFAFKLFDRRIVTALGLRSEGSFIDAELAVRLHRSGHAWTQIGVPYQSRRFGRSSLATLPVILGILRELAKQFGELRGVEPAPMTLGTVRGVG